MNRIPKLYVIVTMAILMVFAVSAKVNNAHAQNNQWVNLYGSAHDDRAMGLAIHVPSSGSPTVFIVGETLGTGTQRLANDADADSTFSNTSDILLSYEVFTARYGSGTLANQGVNKNQGAANGTWTSHLTSTREARGTGVAVDSAGQYIYVTGYTFGSFTSGSQSNQNKGNYDMFLAAYGSATAGSTMLSANVGSTIGTATARVQLFGTAFDDRGRAVAIGGTVGTGGTGTTSKVYVVGETLGSLGSSTTGVANSNSGLADAFVMQFSGNTANTATSYVGVGTATWTKLLGSTGDDFAVAAAADANYVYVAGYTGGNLGGNTNSGTNDGFVAKYGSETGTLSWSKLIGTAADDRASGVAVDAAGDVYVTGYTRGSLDSLGNTGNSDMFVVKYNSSGTKQWTKLLGTSNEDQGTAIAATTNYVLVAGTSEGNIAGDSAFSGIGSDAFVAKYDTSGNWVFTQTLGSSTTNAPVMPTGIGIDTINNHVFVSGYTTGDPDNGSAVVETTNDVNTGNDDIFDWKIGNMANVSVVFASSGDFGSGQIGTTTSLVGTVTNTNSSSSVALGIVSLEGTDNTEFTLQLDNCSNTTLAVSGACNVTVKYNRVTDGSKNIKLKVPNNSTSSSNPFFDVSRAFLQGIATINTASGGGPTASELAVLTSPVNGSTLTGSATTFVWQEGSGGSTNWVYLGSSQGSSDIANTSDTGTANTQEITSIPTDGRALNLRLWTKLTTSNIWKYNDYSFVAAGTSSSSATPTPTPTGGSAASITSPVNASTFTSTSVAFTWAASPGTNVKQYWLDVGTTGVGSWDVFAGSVLTSTSKTVTGLPGSGRKTVYVRLWTQHSDNTWEKTDFTYTSL